MPVHAPSITRVCAERFNGLMCVLMGISQHTDASLMAQSEFGFRGSEKSREELSNIDFVNKTLRIP